MIPFHQRPIWSRVALDIVTLSAIAYSFTIPLYDKNDWTQSLNVFSLVSLSFVLTLFTAGWKTRWTITFPLIVILPLQCFRIYFAHHATCGSMMKPEGAVCDTRSTAILYLIQTTCWILFILSVILCTLFPPVQLRPTDGPHHVAVVDVHIPISQKLTSKTNLSNRDGHPYVIARIAYPVQQGVKMVSNSSPFLPLSLAEKFCNLFMQKGGAPASIQRLTFLLHHWRLIRIHRVTSCPDLPTSSPPPWKNQLPCIVFSHGLTGNAFIYSHITLNLASHGYCVVALDHTDGSALHVLGRNGLEIPFDESFQALDRPETIEAYVRARRDQTQHRVEEVISLIQELKSASSPILGSITMSQVIGMGHSFGGATVLAVAAQRPDLLDSVVALDPAMDWMSDMARWAWLGRHCPEYKGGTGGYSCNVGKETPIQDGKPNLVDVTSLYDIPSFFLYSEEWGSLGWGGYPYVKSLHQKGMMSPSSTAVAVVPGSSHMAFCDICMLIPTWIARSLGLTGKRNPQDVSEEICHRILEFLDR